MSDEAATRAAHVRIEGRVQGVWFRGWTVDEARARGLRGWVRNRMDGSVEAVFIGPDAAVADMIDACWQGPSMAEVTRVLVSPAEDDGSSEFGQRATAQS